MVKEITGNNRRGYEIGSGGGKRSASDALKMWLNSAPHKAVIENTGMWNNKKWSGLVVPLLIINKVVGF